ncbi:hypothetical protein [Nocardioides fonticola]
MTEPLTCPQERARRAVRSWLAAAVVLFLLGLAVPLWALGAVGH